MQVQSRRLRNLGRASGFAAFNVQLIDSQGGRIDDLRMDIGGRTVGAEREGSVPLRVRLALAWQLAHTDTFIECEPGCTEPKIGPTVCASCRDAELADRAAW